MSSNFKNGVNVYIDDIGEESIDRVTKILSGLGGTAIEKAVNSAIKKAARSGEALVASEVRKEYNLTSADFKNNTKSKRHIVTENGSITVNIEYRGYLIPLIKFDTKMGKNGRVVTRVKRNSPKTMLDNVFIAEMTSGHIGAFERVSSKRLPISQKMGPSTPQMMSANDNLKQMVGNREREVFEKNIEHEILAVLNGWRR